MKIYSQNRNFDKKRDKFNFGSIFYLVLFARDYGTLSEILNLPLTLIKYDLTPLNIPPPKPRTRSANERVASFDGDCCKRCIFVVNLLRRAGTRPQIISEKMTMIMIRMRSAAAAAAAHARIHCNISYADGNVNALVLTTNVPLPDHYHYHCCWSTSVEQSTTSSP